MPPDRVGRTGIRDHRDARRPPAPGVPSAVCRRPRRHARRGSRAGSSTGASSLKVVVDRVKLEGDLRARLTDSIETAYREAGGTAFAIEDAPDGATHVFSERFECRTCGLAYELPQPRLFSFNNPFRRLSHLPRIRQHHRARHRSRRSRPDQVGAARGHRAVDEDALSRAARRAQASGQAGRRADGRAVEGPERRASAFRRRGRRPRLRRDSRILPLARQEEVQGPRPGVPEPLPWISDLPRLRRREASAGSPRCSGGRADDRSGVVGHRARSTAVSRSPGVDRERTGDRRQGAQGNPEAVAVSRAMSGSTI